jgi:hypothetical protein
MIFHREDNLPNLDLVAFLNANLLHLSAYRRRHFHDRLVGFELHHRLALADRCAGRDHQAHQVPLFNIFTKYGKLEFDH